MTALLVEATTLPATLQDAGRSRIQHLGLSTGGAIDASAYRLGQQLVGNPEPLAAIETCYGAITLRATGRCLLAITGPAISVHVNDQIIDSNRSVLLAAGDRLKLPATATGVYHYIAIAGGIDLPSVFGSFSTVPREGLGGLAGRALREGDCLPLHRLNKESERSYPCAPIRDNKQPLILRFIDCFHFQQMPVEQQQRLQTTLFTVTASANRMGIKLSGQAINTGIDRLYSESTCLGAIQLPPDGQPIILLNDRQTVGGYPKAGAVLSVDCARLAQCRPGTPVQLQRISVTEADRILWLQWNFEKERVLKTTPNKSAQIDG